MARALRMAGIAGAVIVGCWLWVEIIEFSVWVMETWG